MKITHQVEEFFAIYNPYSGTQPMCFWGTIRYDGLLCTHCPIRYARRFNTQEEALRMIKLHPKCEGKVVKCKTHSSTTVYIHN